MGIAFFESNTYATTYRGTLARVTHAFHGIAVCVCMCVEMEGEVAVNVVYVGAVPSIVVGTPMLMRLIPLVCT